MIFLEIHHPSLQRLRWNLRDGVHVFPPPELEDSVRGCRMRVQVMGQTVHMASLPEGGLLRQDGRIVRQTVVQPDQSVELDTYRLTLRVGTRTLEAAASTGGVIGPGLDFANSLDPDAGTHTLRVQGQDRWVLVSLLAAGRLGRNDLRRIVTIFRNDWISGRRRQVTEILRKGRFLGSRLHEVLAEVDAEWRLGCSRCRREFEPASPVLEEFRCLECDRRLACAPRRRDEAASGSINEALLDSGYDRLTPGTRLGDYKIEQLLGVGGYGAVYKAFDMRIQRTVALKVFPAGREGSADVLREARNVASFPPHPNLVLVYHVGEANSYDYISYEYVSGHSLAYHIERRTKLPLEEKLRLLRDVLGGLATAHRHGVIHRDLKPDNILLVRVEGQFRARLTDFGLGQRLRRGREVYHSRTVRGAPEYLAPEQFRTQVSSVASDLYSVGATFFHVLTGQAPFTGQSDGELAERHLEDPVPSLADMMIRCPRSLDRLFLQLLAKEPKNRPSSAREVLDQLDEVEYELDSLDQAQTSPWATVGLVTASLLLVVGILFGGKLFLPTDGGASEDVAAAKKAAVMDRGATERQETGTGSPASRAMEAAEQRTGPDGAAAPEELLLARGGASPQVPVPQDTLDSTAATEEQDQESDPELDAPAAVVDVQPLPVTDSSAETTSLQNAGQVETPADILVADEGDPEQPVEPPPPQPGPADPDPTAIPGESIAETETSTSPETETSTDLETGELDEAEAVAQEAETETSLFEGLSYLDDLPEAMRRVQTWVAENGERFQDLTETEQAEWRRMEVVMSLLAGTAPDQAGVLQGNWERASYLELRPRRTLVVGGSTALVEVGLPIYSAAQVREWLVRKQDELQAWELATFLSLELPHPDDLSEEWQFPAGEREPCDSLEWVQDTGGLVLYEHPTARVREASRVENYRRPATARLKLTVREPRRLFLQLQSWYEDLSR